MEEYVTLDVESEYDIYFDIKTILTRVVFIWNPHFSPKWVILPKNRQYLKNYKS